MRLWDATLTNRVHQSAFHKALTGQRMLPIPGQPSPIGAERRQKSIEQTTAFNNTCHQRGDTAVWDNSERMYMAQALQKKVTMKK